MILKFKTYHSIWIKTRRGNIIPVIMKMLDTDDEKLICFNGNNILKPKITIATDNVIKRIIEC